MGTYDSFWNYSIKQRKSKNLLNNYKIFRNVYLCEKRDKKRSFTIVKDIELNVKIQNHNQVMYSNETQEIKTYLYISWFKG